MSNLCSVYLLNASSREERQQWMAAVKKCQVALSPKPSPKTERKQIVTSDRSAETKDEGTKAVEVKVTEMPAKSPDQVAFDSDSSSGDGSSTYATVCMFVYHCNRDICSTFGDPVYTQPNQISKCSPPGDRSGCSVDASKL